MFKLNLGNTLNTLSESNFDILSDYTEGYSGSDIAVVVKDALMESIRKCQYAKKFRIDENGFYIPTNVSDPHGTECMLHEINDPSKVKAPPVCMV